VDIYLLIIIFNTGLEADVAT